MSRLNECQHADLETVDFHLDAGDLEQNELQAALSNVLRHVQRLEAKLKSLTEEQRNA